MLRWEVREWMTACATVFGKVRERKKKGAIERVSVSGKVTHEHAKRIRNQGH